jgi:hypothetical protein
MFLNGGGEPGDHGDLGPGIAEARARAVVRARAHAGARARGRGDVHVRARARTVCVRSSLHLSLSISISPSLAPSLPPCLSLLPSLPPSPSLSLSHRGHLKAASRARQKRMISSSVTVEAAGSPALSSMKAHTDSPHLSSGRATTAASATYTHYRERVGD